MNVIDSKNAVKHNKSKIARGFLNKPTVHRPKESVKSTKSAHEFAQLFLTNNNQPGLEVEVEEKDDTTKAAKANDRFGKVSEIDYGKWADYVTSLDKHEEAVLKGKEKEKDELKKAQPVIEGCSHDHSKERQLFEKSTDEKLSAADFFRTKGNEAYKNKNYGLASVYYRKALLQFDYTFPETPEQQTSLKKIKLLCHLNLAASKLELKDYEEVVIQCNLALEVDSMNCKAFFRKGVAYLRQQDFVNAEVFLKKALGREPSNEQILGSIEDLRKEILQYQETKKKVCKAMFTRKEKGDEKQAFKKNEKIEKPEITHKENSSGEIGSAKHKIVADNGRYMRKSETTLSGSSSYRDSTYANSMYRPTEYSYLQILADYCLTTKNVVAFLYFVLVLYLFLLQCSVICMLIYDTMKNSFLSYFIFGLPYLCVLLLAILTLCLFSAKIENGSVYSADKISTTASGAYTPTCTANKKHDLTDIMANIEQLVDNLKFNGASGLRNRIKELREKHLSDMQ